MTINPNGNNFDVDDLYRQAFIYSYLNIISISLFSNIGIDYKLDDKKLNEFRNFSTKKFEGNLYEDLSFFNYMKPLMAIYNRANLNVHFANNGEDIKNILISFNPKDFSFELSPREQSLLIISEIELAKIILKSNDYFFYEDKLLGTILLNSAREQAKFSIKNLINSHGFFYNGKYVHSQGISYEMRLNDSSFDWVNQSYMLLALVKLENIFNNTSFVFIKDTSENKTITNSIDTLLQLIIDNEEEIIDLSTADLSVFLTNITEVFNISESNYPYYSFILNISDELKSREYDDGYIYFNSNRNKISSLSTHFKTIEALSNSYKYTNYYCFKDTAELIYNKLDTAWDENLGLFRIHKKNKIKYTAKSIGYVLKSLNIFADILDDKDKTDQIWGQIHSFFNSCLNITGLQVLPNIDIIDFDTDINNIVPNDLHRLFKKGNVYIPLRGFDIDQRKDKIKVYGHRFLTEYALTLVEALLVLSNNE